MTCLPKQIIMEVVLAFDLSYEGIQLITSISWWKSSTFIWFFLDVTKTNKRSKLKDNIDRCMPCCLHFCSPKSFRNSAIFFIPWETISMNSLFSQSCWICCWTSELILRLRLGKNSTCFLQEDSRMWKINSTGLNNQRKIFSFETHEHFNIGSKLLWEKQTWPPKLIFYALVEERLSIWSSGPSVHLIGKSLCLKLYVYTRYYCIHETLSLNLFSCPLIRLCHSALNLNLTLFINFHSFKNHFVYRRVRYLVVSRISRFFISATCGVCLLNVFSISDFLWCKTSVR